MYEDLQRWPLPWPVLVWSMTWRIPRPSRDAVAYLTYPRIYVSSRIDAFIKTCIAERRENCLLNCIYWWKNVYAIDECDRGHWKDLAMWHHKVASHHYRLILILSFSYSHWNVAALDLRWLLLWILYLIGFLSLMHKYIRNHRDVNNLLTL